ncbi:hypothetical protein SAMD00079811_52760 [Scytonema sp. HK-05]|nr:hypothetical protein SAMD00079811_52760 [Scytonema sp. HK-05]
MIFRGFFIRRTIDPRLRTLDGEAMIHPRTLMGRGFLTVFR